MVVVADPDDDGVVRMVSVGFRPRHKSDNGKPYASKAEQTMTIGAQRFAVLMAVEEVDKMAQQQPSRDCKESSAPHLSGMTLN